MPHPAPPQVLIEHITIIPHGDDDATWRIGLVVIDHGNWKEFDLREALRARIIFTLEEPDVV